jgi:hypothetical protein
MSSSSVALPDREIECFKTAVQHICATITTIASTNGEAKSRRDASSSALADLRDLPSLVSLLWELMTDPSEPRRMITMLADGAFVDMSRKVLTTNPIVAKHLDVHKGEEGAVMIDQLQHKIIELLRNVLQEGGSAPAVVSAVAPHLRRNRISEVLLRYANIEPSTQTIEALFFSVTWFEVVTDVLSVECFLALLQIGEVTTDEVRSYALAVLKFLAKTKGGDDVMDEMAKLCLVSRHDDAVLDVTVGEQFYLMLLRMIYGCRPRFQQNAAGELLWRLMVCFLTGAGPHHVNGSARRLPRVVLDSAATLISTLCGALPDGAEPCKAFPLLLEMCILQPEIAAAQGVALLETFLRAESSQFNAGRVCRYFIQSLLSAGCHSKLFGFLQQSSDLLEPVMERIISASRSSQNSEFALMMGLMIAAADTTEPFRRVLEHFCDTRGGGVALLEAIHHIFCQTGTSDELTTQVSVVDSKGNLLNSVETVDQTVPGAWTDVRLLPVALEIIHGRLREPTPPKNSEFQAHSFPVSWAEKHAKITSAVLTEAILRCSLSE